MQVWLKDNLSLDGNNCIRLLVFLRVARVLWLCWSTGQLQSSVLFQLCHCVPVWMGSYASSELARVELIVQSGTRTTKYVAI